MPAEPKGTKTVPRTTVPHSEDPPHVCPHGRLHLIGVSSRTGEAAFPLSALDQFSADDDPQLTNGD